MYRFVRFGLKLGKYFSVGSGATLTYFGVQYHRDVGISKLQEINQQNIQDISKWVKWKCRDNAVSTEKYLARCCCWCSSMQWFHSLDVATFLIYLANVDSPAMHTFFVKLLSAVRFPEGTDMRHYMDKCKPKVVIGLARTNDIDPKWFQYEDSQDCCAEIEEDVLEGRMSELLDAIHSIVGEDSCDPCSMWLIRYVIEQKLPPDPEEWVCPMNDLSTERDTVDFEQNSDKITFTEKLGTYLEIFERHSTNKEVATDVSISQKLIDVLRLVCLKYPEDQNTLVAAGNILANLGVWNSNYNRIAHTDILNILFGWRKSRSVAIQLTASRILQNLDSNDYGCTCLNDGIYTVHPDTRSDDDIDVDVVFIHGIKGSPFYTWRQTPSETESTDDGTYTYCWPKDWLSVDHPNIRILSVAYKSTISDWLLSCPSSKQEYSLDHQAKMIRQKLKDSGLGTRPIIWVTHSMGGLITKKILANFELDELVTSTEGIVFYSVPHLGSPIATHSEKASYILFPSIEVNELSENSPKLEQLHKNFANLLESQPNIECVDIGETIPLSFSYMVNFLVVPQSSSDVGYGKYVLAEADHQNICKPESKTDSRYLEVKNLVKKVQSKHLSFRGSN